MHTACIFQPARWPEVVTAHSTDFLCAVLISSDAETTVPAHSSGNKAAISLEFWWSETVHVFVIYQRVLCRWTILPVLTLQLSECEVEVRLQSGEWTI